ncbi:protein SENSITIVE TO PROTON RHIZOTOXICITY 1 [Gossypium australe]|uniref:Protein SENSITIVE TO PROTON RHIZOTOXICITY 1 n=1 Tax=Gossypium australe TaxID=47621 RepID=A0A5B6UUN3_9ROSI|nr:protein SENSITIVE TO PROTON RHIZOTOXICITY 1 [Gossypium australe]
MAILHQFLSQSLDANTLISEDHMDLVSSELASAVHQSEIIELNAVELLSDHLRICGICGKGFKRDANLRMHMRAHGNQYKTPEALAKKPENGSEVKKSGRKTGFSCPYGGCSRNNKHDKFRPLKSVICVRNHFKRNHCPKRYGCNECHKKKISVLADLKSRLKHCAGSSGGEESKKWKCSCGNSFCRKNKLFRHLSLFEGHSQEEEEDDGFHARSVGTIITLTIIRVSVVKLERKKLIDIAEVDELIMTVSIEALAMAGVDYNEWGLDIEKWEGDDESQCPPPYLLAEENEEEPAKVVEQGTRIIGTSSPTRRSEDDAGEECKHRRLLRRKSSLAKKMRHSSKSIKVMIKYTIMLLMIVMIVGRKRFLKTY